MFPSLSTAFWALATQSVVWAPGMDILDHVRDAESKASFHDCQGEFMHMQCEKHFNQFVTVTKKWLKLLRRLPSLKAAITDGLRCLPPPLSLRGCKPLTSVLTLLTTWWPQSPASVLWTWVVMPSTVTLISDQKMRGTLHMSSWQLLSHRTILLTAVTTLQVRASELKVCVLWPISLSVTLNKMMRWKLIISLKNRFGISLGIFSSTLEGIYSSHEGTWLFPLNTMWLLIHKMDLI